MKRFEIWTADLPALAGSSRKGIRSLVIIVSNDGPYATLSALTVVPLTKNLSSQQLPSHVLLCSQHLDHPCRALCEQITTVPKTCLRRRIGYVEDPYDRFALNRALAVHLNLTLTPYIKEDSIYDDFGNL